LRPDAVVIVNLVLTVFNLNQQGNADNLHGLVVSISDDDNLMILPGTDRSKSVLP
jgi:hypothetical protein